MLGNGAGVRVRGLGWWWAGSLGVVAVAVVALRSVDPGVLGETFSRALARPAGIAAALALYASAFVLRAWVWTRVVPGLRFGVAWAAIHVSLGANHVLPLRLGEVFRVTSVVSRGGIPLGVATSSPSRRSPRSSAPVWWKSCSAGLRGSP